MKTSRLNLKHDTGEFRFRYLLHPPTGRSKIDLAFDLLTLSLLLAAWILALLLGPAGNILPIAVIFTLLALYGLGNACRDIKTVRRNLRQVPIDYPAKVRYAHCLHSQAPALPAIGILLILHEAHILADGPTLALIAVLVLYLLAMSLIFRTTPQNNI